MIEILLYFRPMARRETCRTHRSVFFVCETQANMCFPCDRFRHCRSGSNAAQGGCICNCIWQMSRPVSPRSMGPRHLKPLLQQFISLLSFTPQSTFFQVNLTKYSVCPVILSVTKPEIFRNHSLENGGLEM